MNRPSDPGEASPETLVADIVKADLTSEPVDQRARDRKSRIERRAYLLAERRGFAPGRELDDWLQAEKEVDEEPPRQTSPEDQFTG